MSFGVDTLGALIEKLKQLVNETQDKYESFFDNTQLFRQGKMDNKEYFTKMGEYLVSSSALNFLTSRIILEIKSVLDKGVSGKTLRVDLQFRHLLTIMVEVVSMWTILLILEILLILLKTMIYQSLRKLQLLSPLIFWCQNKTLLHLEKIVLFVLHPFLNKQNIVINVVIPNN